MPDPLAGAAEATMGDYWTLAAHFSRFVARRIDSHYRIWQAGWWQGPDGGILAWDPGEAEEFGRAGLGIIEARFGPLAAAGLDFLGAITGPAVSFYGSRMDRPYRWWSPMKWLPQEDYLQQVFLPRGDGKPEAVPKDLQGLGDPEGQEGRDGRDLASRLFPDPGRRRQDYYWPVSILPPPPPWGALPATIPPTYFQEPLARVEGELGGISLEAAATSPTGLGLENVVGAVWDARTGNLVLLGEDSHLAISGLLCLPFKLLVWPWLSKAFCRRAATRPFRSTRLILKTREAPTSNPFFTAPSREPVSGRPCLTRIGS